MRASCVAAVAVVLGFVSVARAEEPEKFKLIHVQDVVQLQKAKTQVFLLDANNPEFRAKNGTIPGASYLSSSSSYDVKKELPADKGAKLVFFCANTH